MSQRIFNVEKLKNEVISNASANELKTHTTDNNSERSWQEIKDIFIKVAENHLGFKNNNRKEWINDTKWRLIQDRRRPKLP